jgi:hypothetical protein
VKFVLCREIDYSAGNITQDTDVGPTEAGGVFTGSAGRAGRPRPGGKTPALLYLLFLSTTQDGVP